MDGPPPGWAPAGRCDRTFGAELALHPGHSLNPVCSFPSASSTWQVLTKRGHLGKPFEMATARGSDSIRSHPTLKCSSHRLRFIRWTDELRPRCTKQEVHLSGASCVRIL